MFLLDYGHSDKRAAAQDYEPYPQLGGAWFGALPSNDFRMDATVRRQGNNFFNQVLTWQQKKARGKEKQESMDSCCEYYTSRTEPIFGYIRMVSVLRGIQL